ncbi:hypothetical protein B484DRAFT_316731, partial [Ochromonadaceae sp. CCMP2298]
VNDSFTALNQAWATEVNAPEILPYRHEIVSEIKSQLTTQQESIDQKGQEAEEGEYFIISLYQMDVERVRYSLTRYLRARLLKIERSLEHIVSDINAIELLSKEERAFATRLNALNNAYFEDTVSSRLAHAESREYYGVSENKIKNARPSGGFVFCRAKADLQDLAVSADQTSTLWAGDIGILHYSVIQEQVRSGQAELL